MAGGDRRKVERSGAFLSDGFQNIPVPIRTLQDDYHDTPEPQDSDVVPPREPEGLVTRVVHSLQGKHPHDED
jgi:hypothetical protein